MKTFAKYTLLTFALTVTAALASARWHELSIHDPDPIPVWLVCFPIGLWLFSWGIAIYAILRLIIRRK